MRAHLLRGVRVSVIQLPRIRGAKEPIYPLRQSKGPSTTPSSPLPAAGRAFVLSPREAETRKRHSTAHIPVSTPASWQRLDAGAKPRASSHRRITDRHATSQHPLSGRVGVRLWVCVFGLWLLVRGLPCGCCGCNAVLEPYIIVLQTCVLRTGRQIRTASCADPYVRSHASSFPRHKLCASVHACSPAWRLAATRCMRAWRNRGESARSIAAQVRCLDKLCWT